MSFLTMGLCIFVGLLLFQISSRAFALSSKQAEVREQLQVYEEAVRTLETKLKVLNLTTGSPFTQEEYELYDGLIKRIRKMEAVV